MISKPVPFLLRALVAVTALLGVLAASYLAREQAATPAPAAAAPVPDVPMPDVPAVDVALFAVG